MGRRVDRHENWRDRGTSEIQVPGCEHADFACVRRRYRPADFESVIRITERGCVEDQPQKASHITQVPDFPACYYRTFLRLVFDTAALQIRRRSTESRLFQPLYLTEYNACALVTRGEKAQCLCTQLLYVRVSRHQTIRLHAHRIARGNCHHRDSGRNAVARSGSSQSQGATNGVSQQS